MSEDPPASAAAAPESTRFVLVRHAQSVWNARGVWQGQADPPLSEDGRAQAAALARSLEGTRADGLVCSDLVRARETAEAIGAVLGLEPRVTAALRELDVGRWSGRTRAEIEASDRELLAEFESQDPHVRPGGGETRQELRDRVRACVEALAAERPGAHLIVVAHLGVVRALVPGAEPGHGEIVEATLAEIRAAMARRARAPESTAAL